MRSQFAAVAVLVTAVFLAAGCQPADCVYPLYKATDTDFDDRLLGIWQPAQADASDEEKQERWSFVHSKEANFYDFKLGAVGKKGGLIAKVHIVLIGGNLFVDFHGDFDRAFDDQQPDNLTPLPGIPTHGIGRIWIEQDSLRIHFLKDDWVKDQAKAGTLMLAHLDLEGSPLVTATTDELRKFMQAHADDAEALSENYELKRVK